MFVTPDADIKMTVIGAVLSCGTAGQRCTSTRQLFMKVFTIKLKMLLLLTSS
jgi:acyl-CoA reductase-like NAD-dependent aldehyde dehydrogenase